MLPADGRVTRCLASHPPGPRGSSSPASAVLSRHCDFLPPIPPRFVAFAWRYHGTTHVSLPPPLRAVASGLGLVARYPRPGSLPWRRQDLPSSWGTSTPVCTCSQTPAGRDLPDRFQDARAAPALRTTRAPALRTISGLNSMAFGLAVYASRCQLPFTAQDSLPGAGQALLDGLYPQGPITRFQIMSCDFSPCPSFLAQPECALGASRVRLGSSWVDSRFSVGSPPPRKPVETRRIWLCSPTRENVRDVHYQSEILEH